MSDPKQSIYNARNWLGAAIPQSVSDERDLIIKAHETIHLLPIDNRRAFIDLIAKLQQRERTLDGILKAWEASLEQLRFACQAIDEERQNQLRMKK